MPQTHDTGQSGFETVVVGLLRDVRALVRQEMALARHEVEYQIGKIVKAVLWFGIAVVMAVIGLMTIAAACVLLLYEYTGLPAWVCRECEYDPTRCGGGARGSGTQNRKVRSYHARTIRPNHAGRRQVDGELGAHAVCVDIELGHAILKKPRVSLRWSSRS